MRKCKRENAKLEHWRVGHHWVKGMPLLGMPPWPSGDLGKAVVQIFNEIVSACPTIHLKDLNMSSNEALQATKDL